MELAERAQYPYSESAVISVSFPSWISEQVLLSFRARAQAQFWFTPKELSNKMP